ncbi:MAG: hypothetical protein LUG88_03105 [Clostridia bacterium]|nr:hypothetical protein [Clostridia bacterium]
MRNESENGAGRIFRDRRLDEITDILPPDVRRAVSAAVSDAASLLGGAPSVSEIRLRVGGVSSIASGGRTFPLRLTVSPDKMSEIIRALTDGSLYAHADTIRDGYIFSHGVRCGVCGRAVVRGGKIDSVCDITSVTMRIPHDVSGCASGVFRIFSSKLKSARGIIVYSPPGVGKTTLLRDFILTASRRLNVAVADERGELYRNDASGSVDYLLGYPKHAAIIQAVRSLSPSLIICDELFGSDDADAAMYAYSCGVPLIASAHAGNFAELSARLDISRLTDARAFGCCVGISRAAAGGSFSLETEYLS